MRVAFLTMGKDIGGAKNDIITLSQKIARRGHQVYVISSPGVMDKELAGTGVQVLPADFYVRRPWELWKASRVLLRMVRDNHIELLNPQGFFTAVIAWLIRFGLGGRKIPVITTIHMFSSLTYYKYAYMLNWFSDAIITESNCERIRLQGGGAKRSKITVINNSVDMTRFSQQVTTPVLRKEYDLADGVFCFGLIARLSPEKRHKDFIDAARIVHLNYPEAVFFIIGDGPMLADMMHYAKDCKDYILFTGNRRDVPNVLRSLNCFVLCSEVESLPLSIREAMSMEIPQIATDVGGNREIVAEGITGLIVPPKNPSKLAEAMMWMLANPKDIKQMGQKSRQFCRRRFDAEDWAIYTERKFIETL